jgi:quinol monooxygenase YgiN
MRNLEVIARMKIRPGQLEAFKSQVDEILRSTREKDTHTLRCDVFVNENGTECEVHEEFPDEQGLIEHKMNTMAPTVVLFRDHALDHQAAIFGEVSLGFINLVTERMGPPTVFAFVQGLQAPSTPGGGTGHLEVIARMKIRPGHLDGFKAQAAELIRLTEEKDARTLRYDWFVSEDGLECEVHEAYLGAEGLVEHNTHIMEARSALFRDYAFDHRMSAYGEVSQELRDLGQKHAGGFREFSFLQGLERAPAV